MILSVSQYLDRTAAAVEEIREANLSLRRAHKDTIAALSRSMEAKDLYTGGHTERVAAVTVGLARRLGFRDEELEAIEIGALLHDIGKIGVPGQVLRKNGPLTDDEWELVKKHPLISDYILSELDLHPFVRQCARSSHERIDGTGYPDGLSGEEIPLPARIVLRRGRARRSDEHPPVSSCAPDARGPRRDPRPRGHTVLPAGRRCARRALAERAEDLYAGAVARRRDGRSVT